MPDQARGVGLIDGVSEHQLNDEENKSSLNQEFEPKSSPDTLSLNATFASSSGRGYQKFLNLILETEAGSGSRSDQCWAVWLNAGLFDYCSSSCLLPFSRTDAIFWQGHVRGLKV